MAYNFNTRTLNLPTELIARYDAKRMPFDKEKIIKKYTELLNDEKVHDIDAMIKDVTAGKMSIANFIKHSHEVVMFLLLSLKEDFTDLKKLHDVQNEAHNRLLQIKRLIDKEKPVTKKDKENFKLIKEIFNDFDDIRTTQNKIEKAFAAFLVSARLSAINLEAKTTKGKDASLKLHILSEFRTSDKSQTSLHETVLERLRIRGEAASVSHDIKLNKKTQKEIMKAIKEFNRKIFEEIEKRYVDHRAKDERKVEEMNSDLISLHKKFRKETNHLYKYQYETLRDGQKLFKDWMWMSDVVMGKVYDYKHEVDKLEVELEIPKVFAEDFKKEEQKEIIEEFKNLQKERISIQTLFKNMEMTT